MVIGLYSDEAFPWLCDCFSNVGEVRCALSLLGSPVKDVCSYEVGYSFSLPAPTRVLGQNDTCGPNSQTCAAHLDVCV